MFVCKFLGSIIPLDVPLRLFDALKERAHGLRLRSILDVKESIDCAWVPQIAGKSVTRLGCVCHDTAVPKNGESLFYASGIGGNDVHRHEGTVRRNGS